MQFPPVWLSTKVVIEKSCQGRVIVLRAPLLESRLNVRRNGVVVLLVFYLGLCYPLEEITRLDGVFVQSVSRRSIGYFCYALERVMLQFVGRLP